MKDKVLVYGANGYTGTLIARHAAEYGIHPILAGRNENAICTLGESLGFSCRVIDLEDKVSLEISLRDVALVIHAAGPFQFTAVQMVEACLATRTHYIDINGDITVFELLKRYDKDAKQAGIMMLPGAGFDVVPTDCIAKYLKDSLPTANQLEIAFATIGGSISHGTATSMIHKLGEGGAVRRNGRIVKEPLGRHSKWVDFRLKRLFVMSMPWGDISTAHFTTGIPNITTYAGISRTISRFLKFQFLFNPLHKTKFFRRILQNRIDKRPKGPDDERRQKAIGLVWGCVKDENGKEVIARITGPEGYTITYHACLIIAKKILAGNFKSGYQTPASAYGAELVYQIPGVKKLD